MQVIHAGRFITGHCHDNQRVQKTVKGAVLFALADTLDAQSMGGFKVGVGFSFCKCRMCLATRDQLPTKVRSVGRL